MAKYQVTISQVWSDTIIVNAKTSSEAKMKAWKKHNPKKKDYELSAEREPNK